MFKPARITRLLLLLMAGGFAGCVDEPHNYGTLEAVWGRRGLSDGRFQKPRAMALDEKQRIYIVDMTARIQVFTADGEFLRSWQTPVHDNGRPTGLTIDSRGRLLVADTHYFRILVYSPEGELLEVIGGTEGHGPGEFGLVTDAVVDRKGNMYVAEYGEYDRIQKFSPAGEFLLQWGGHGAEPGQFARPQNLAIDSRQRIWVVDACNHRLQIFDTEGSLLEVRCRQGSALGELSYPYDLVFDDEENLYVCEFGNHRVQKFSPEGTPIGCWGKHGRCEGELHNPWALVWDRQGRIHVLDTYNHRVQRVRM